MPNLTPQDSGLSQNMEDYLETILLLCKENSVARVKDIAARLNVKVPSAISAIKKLSELGMLDHEHYGYIQLTAKGRELAQNVYANHLLIYEFFTRVLGVDQATADNDACMMEHYISQETRRRLAKFIDFVNSFPEKDVEAPWLINFRRYLEDDDVSICDCRFKTAAPEPE